MTLTNPEKTPIFYINPAVYAFKSIRMENVTDQMLQQMIADLESLRYHWSEDFEVRFYKDDIIYLLILNEKIVQDTRIRKLLLEYLI